KGIRKAASTLACSPHAPRLTALRCSFCQPGTPGLRQLADSETLADVADLRLAHAELTAADVRALAGREWLRLRELDLTNNSLMGDDGAKALAALRLPGLRRLNLTRTGLTAVGLRELLAAPWCAGLETLDLTHNNGLGDDGARTL